MRIIVTGSRELEYSEPFDTAARQVTASVLSKMGAAPKQDDVKLASTKGRDYARTLVVKEVFTQLDAIAQQQKLAGDPVTCIVHGGAVGIDRYAGLWAAKRGIPQQVYKPRWEKWDARLKKLVFDPQAGFKRNWYMLFREAGKDVEADLQKKTGKLAVKQARILKLIVKAKALHSEWALHQLVPVKVILEDSRHPERQATLVRLGVAVPKKARVVGFHDGESRGTSHAMMVGGQLGYSVRCFTYHKPERPDVETGRINHRPDIRETELGSGRKAS